MPLSFYFEKFYQILSIFQYDTDLLTDVSDFNSIPLLHSLQLFLFKFPFWFLQFPLFIFHIFATLCCKYNLPIPLKCNTFLSFFFAPLFLYFTFPMKFFRYYLFLHSIAYLFCIQKNRYELYFIPVFLFKFLS